MDAQRGAGLLEEAGHAEREGVRDLGAFVLAAAKETAEVISLVVEAAVGEGLVELDFAGSGGKARPIRRESRGHACQQGGPVE